MTLYSIPARKYVYPALALLFLFLLLMRHAAAADTTPAVSPTSASSAVVNSMDRARDDMNSATRNAILNAQERVRNTSALQNRSDEFEDAVEREENRLRNQYRSQAEYIDGWRRTSGNAYDEDTRFDDDDYDWDKYDDLFLNERIRPINDSVVRQTRSVYAPRSGRMENRSESRLDADRMRMNERIARERREMNDRAERLNVRETRREARLDAMNDAERARMNEKQARERREIMEKRQREAVREARENARLDARSAAERDRLEDRARRDARIRDERNTRAAVRETRSEIRADARYEAERARLDSKRARDLREFNEKRAELREDISREPRGSNHYIRLQNRLTDLEKKHAESELDYEKDFRNLDAKYSYPRW